MSSKQITPFKPYESRSPNGNEKGYVRITNSIHESDAMRDLSDLAFRVFLDMRFVSKGHGEVIYTQKMGAERLNLSKGGYTSAINQLITVGLVERLPRGCYAPAKYKFSTSWKTYYSRRRGLFSGEYTYKNGV